MNLAAIPPALRLKGEAQGLVPVAIPALVSALFFIEEEKGAPLTQDEVKSIRDTCVCMMLPPEIIQTFEASRGHADVRLEHVWEDWLEARAARPS